MPFEKVEFKALLNTRDQLIASITKDLTENERKFLLSIKEGTPNWGLLGVAGAEKLPAIQWKLMNIQKMKLTTIASRLNASSDS